MRRVRLAAIVTALALLVTAVPGQAYAAKTLALSSGTFAFEVDPGGSGSGEVTVINDGDEPLKALVYITDVQIDAAGEQTYVTPAREGAALLSTPASWFRIYMPTDSKALGNTPYLEMEPGERVPIRFEFFPPASAAPGDHNTVIFFEMFDFADGDGSVAQVSGRLGSRVAVRVTGQTIEKLSVRPFKVPAFQIGSSVPFTFTVNNEGNINKRVQVSVAVLDRSEQVVSSSLVATDTALYADSSRQFTGAVSAGSGRVGPHSLEVRVEYTEDGAQLPTTMVEQRTVWLLPYWVVALLGFLVVYSLGYLLVRALGRRRRRRATPPDGDAPPRRSRGSHRARSSEAEERRRAREERAAHAAREASAGEPPVAGGD